MAAQGVGVSVRRKEDDRFLRGKGQFVADIRLAGMKDVAFVRSPVAHARILGVSIPDEHRDAVFLARDLENVKPIRAVSGLPGFKVSEQPVLADGKLRHVGEPVAMCLAPTRAEAEDIAGAVSLDLDELPAVGAVAHVPTLVLRNGEEFRLFFPQEYGHYMAEVVIDTLEGISPWR
jgi:carbon-monoxide dehydrogenase large subunit